MTQPNPTGRFKDERRSFPAAQFITQERSAMKQVEGLAKALEELGGVRCADTIIISGGDYTAIEERIKQFMIGGFK